MDDNSMTSWLELDESDRAVFLGLNSHDDFADGDFSQKIRKLVSRVEYRVAIPADSAVVKAQSSIGKVFTAKSKPVERVSAKKKPNGNEPAPKTVLDDSCKRQSLGDTCAKSIAEWPYAKFYESTSGTRVVETGSSSESMDWIRKEFEFLAAVNSPHVLRTIHLDLDQGQVVIEPILGTLQQALEESKRSPTYAKRVMNSMLKGLAAYHKKERIHGEICLNRILVANDGTPRLAGSPGFKVGEEMRPPMGDSELVAPELLSSSRFGAVSPAADIYCLGHVVLNLILGDRYRDLLTQNGNRQLTRSELVWHGSEIDELPPLSELLPDLPELSTVLQKMIAKKVESRYQTVEEVLADLNGHMNTKVAAVKQITTATKKAAKISTPIKEPSSQRSQKTDHGNSQMQIRQPFFHRNATAVKIAAGILFAFLFIGIGSAINKASTADQPTEANPQKLLLSERKGTLESQSMIRLR